MTVIDGSPALTEEEAFQVFPEGPPSGGGGWSSTTWREEALIPTGATPAL